MTSSQESADMTSQSEDDGRGHFPIPMDEEKENSSAFHTPKRIRNKRLDLLTQESLMSPQLRIPASPMMQRLGYGTGVGVYLMERSPKPTGEIRSPWAIKKVSNVQEKSEVYSRRLAYEAEILRHLQHPNVIGYRAFGALNGDSAYLAMEKASTSLGDLIEEKAELQMLMDDSVPPFSAVQMEKVAVDVARALDYLHSDKKMIHGDLKSANVLVFGDFEIAKICDFGVSRKIKTEDGTIEGRYVGTEIWNPMEVIMEKRGKKTYPITSKSDIYPYGLTIHEMLSLKPPHFNTAEEHCIGSCTSEEGDSSPDYNENEFDKALEQQLGKRPAIPDMDFTQAYNLILGVFYCCTEEDPNKRPSAKELLKMLTCSEKV